jgi:flagellar motor switch protein FliM
MTHGDSSSGPASDSDPLARLRTIGESYGRNLATALSGMLRTLVEVKLAGIEECSDREFLLHCDDPTYLNVLQAESVEERFLLDINLSILFPIIDRLLGGGRAASPPLRRPLTEIENRLAGRITTVLLDELRHTCKGTLELRFAVEQTESDPQAVPTTTLNPNMFRVQFDLLLAGAHGVVNLGIPVSAMERIDSSGAASASGTTSLDGNYVPVVAELTTTKIRTADLAGLEVGDIITTEQKVDEPIVIRIDGAPHFLARSGACNGRKAIRIVKPLAADGKE